MPNCGTTWIPFFKINLFRIDGVDIENGEDVVRACGSGMRFRVKPGMREGAMLEWSTAGATKWARNVPRGVLEHGWGNDNGRKRAARRAGRFLHSLVLGRNDRGPGAAKMVWHEIGLWWPEMRQTPV